MIVQPPRPQADRPPSSHCALQSALAGLCRHLRASSRFHPFGEPRRPRASTLPFCSASDHVSCRRRCRRHRCRRHLWRRGNPCDVVNTLVLIGPDPRGFGARINRSANWCRSGPFGGHCIHRQPLIAAPIGHLAPLAAPAYRHWAARTTGMPLTSRTKQLVSPDRNPHDKRQWRSTRQLYLPALPVGQGAWLCVILEVPTLQSCS